MRASRVTFIACRGIPMTRSPLGFARVAGGTLVPRSAGATAPVVALVAALMPKSAVFIGIPNPGFAAASFVLVLASAPTCRRRTRWAWN